MAIIAGQWFAPKKKKEEEEDESLIINSVEFSKYCYMDGFTSFIVLQL